MWLESSSVKGVNLVKKSVTVTEIMNFSQGIGFLLAHPVYITIFAIYAAFSFTLAFMPFMWTLSLLLLCI